MISHAGRSRSPISSRVRPERVTNDEYERTEKETGAFDKTDYISGPLFDELLKKFKTAVGVVPSVYAIEDAPLKPSINCQNNPSMCLSVTTP